MADRSPDCPTKRLPDLQDELWPPVVYYVNRNPVDLENVKDEEFGGLQGRREFGQGDKMHSLRKSVKDGEYDSFTLRRWQSCHKVHGDVRPRSMGHRQRS